MSLSGILGTATSGLQTAQTQLRLVSDNIANVNTPGYARKVADQTAVSLSLMGGGVSIDRISRAVDQFLTQASYASTAQAQGQATLADMLDRAQSLFGDPTEGAGYFNQLDQAFAAFSAAAQDPASTVARNQALNAISSFLDQSRSMSQDLQGLSVEAGRRIDANVTQVNDLLSQIADLNSALVKGTVEGADTTGAQNSQSQLIDALSQALDINVTRRSDGGVDIRSSDGALLVGRAGPATLSFVANGTAPGRLMAYTPGGSARPLEPADGVLRGLIDVRNQEIPAISAQLGEYVSRAVDEINRAHNASSAVPPPNQLTGRNTGLDLPTAVSGFTGKTTVAITNSASVVQTRVDIDFDAGTMSADGGPPVGFTPSNFLTMLNLALTPFGSASFSGGALSLQASSGNGVTVADDPTTPSQKAGKGFSHFFGLNDLVTSTGFPYLETGLTGTDLNGFNAGGVVTLRLLDASGAALRDAAITAPAGGTVDDFINALNANSGGVGLYGAFGLDAHGELSFTPSIPGVSVSVVSDTTQRGAGGPSASQLFGIDPNIRAQRAASFQIRSDIAADPMKLSLAQFDTTAVAGQAALSKGDSRGAQRLAAAGEATVAFDPAGQFGPLSASLSQYGAQFSGALAQRAAAASAAKDAAQAVGSEADSRRASVEGVNLDEEMIKLTTYQQAYNASARIIQAVNDMYDLLMNLK